ncbi:MAG: ABC transporter ATP-binding protein, partial [Limnohabitans sp.]
NYEGTVFLVSHDRSFLDNVVTSTIAYEGDAHWREYEGGVQDWLLQSQRAKAWAEASKTTPAPSVTHDKNRLAAVTPKTTASTKKLSFKEQREYDALPGLIDLLEAEQAQLNEQLADGSLYVTDPTGASAKAARVAQIDDELLAALERWETLGQRVTV